MDFYESKPSRVRAIQWNGDWEAFKAAFDAVNENTQNVLGLVDGNPFLSNGLVTGALAPTNWLIINDNGVASFANDETFHQKYVFAEGVFSVDGGSAENPLGD